MNFFLTLWGFTEVKVWVWDMRVGGLTPSCTRTVVCWARSTQCPSLGGVECSPLLQCHGRAKCSENIQSVYVVTTSCNRNCKYSRPFLMSLVEYSHENSLLLYLCRMLSWFTFELKKKSILKCNHKQRLAVYFIYFYFLFQWKCLMVKPHTDWMTYCMI